ncbi:exodeoxyribonuclease VII small subunit [Uliginosibacterium sp. H3]|uniref:Exodeoxyribonuclease 7 small subunit n=1 Tax=Uliginosibacterium silvisoli TaxID=3114758 RepID=A0ABU6K3Y2_9RHOO|nr:exodeoxyribonuclease VII small subunit [Uliginosibacterium sp. H3]
MAPPKTSPTAKPDTKAALPERFEDAVGELEQIVAAMETGTLSLEESLARFQRGTQLLRHCRGALESAEQRIRVLQDGELRDLPADTDGE